MKFKELFRRAPNLSPDALRKYRDEHREDEYTLLDVRQPGNMKAVIWRGPSSSLSPSCRAAWTKWTATSRW